MRRAGDEGPTGDARVGEHPAVRTPGDVSDATGRRRDAVDVISPLKIDGVFAVRLGDGMARSAASVTGEVGLVAYEDGTAGGAPLAHESRSRPAPNCAARPHGCVARERPREAWGPL